jgi:hypothetical protein
LVQRVLREFPQVKYGEINSLEEPERLSELGFVASSASVITGEVEFSSLPKEKVLRQRLEELVKEMD